MHFEIKRLHAAAGLRVPGANKVAHCSIGSSNTFSFSGANCSSFNCTIHLGSDAVTYTGAFCCTKHGTKHGSFCCAVERAVAESECCTDAIAYAGSFCCAKHVTHCCTVARSVSESKCCSVAVANSGTEYSTDARADVGAYTSSGVLHDVQRRTSLR